IFGANDGLVSNLALIMGIAGAKAEPGIVVLAGIAGLLAGAFSMGAGEFISMRVKRDVFENLLAFERDELETMPDAEMRELAGIYKKRGIPDNLAVATAQAVHADLDLALETHAREELGLDPNDLGSPWGAAISSFITFSIGALIPLVPFLFGSGTAAIAWASILSGATLFAIGAAMTVFTGKNLLAQGLKMLAVGGAAAITTYLVGSILGVNLS
ncbi:MAG: VIT1/CCC1 transporter family protein, partial [Actinobacteria bacterium]|nr:VIT1/CCC1 transporter family protein [Actinomycetota bacterium]